jgi:16S rRNA (cytosine1402-N4)-methyltransferase
MLNEVLAYLDCEPAKVYVDGTLGGAGHARAILEKIIPTGFLIGIDRDKAAVANATRTLASCAKNMRLFRGNFARLPGFLSQANIAAVDGILLDLGISSDQLRSSGRGFSFMLEEPLDMRMNPESGPTAGALVNEMEEKGLKDIFTKYGEERWARQIARKIVTIRNRTRITSSRQLSQIICEAIPKKSLYAQKIHPATRAFMALRIAVNRELEHLEQFLNDFADLLKPGGRLCVISFHSLEDRMVKRMISVQASGCDCPPDFPVCACGKQPVVRWLTPKVVRASEAEVNENPLARSARLRACEKL